MLTSKVERGAATYKGILVPVRRQCNHVRSNLVCDVAISGDTIGPYDDPFHHTPLAEQACMIVGHDSYIYSQLLQLPRSEAGTLKIGSGLGSIDSDILAGLDCGSYHPESRTIAACCECARVAMGEDRVAVIDKLRTVQRQFPVILDVIRVDFEGGLQHVVQEVLIPLELLVRALHLSQRPE